jgi:uncharacterized protein (TIGR02598 family)
MSRSPRNLQPCSAFSLVEVVLALGVVSFALLALVGTLPAGVKALQDSMSESARANTTQQIRAELEQVSFGTNAAGVNYIDTLSQQTNYYSSEGLPLSNSSGAYYMAAFQVQPATIPGTTSNFQSTSAQTIQVILSYPLNAPASSRTQTTNYLFTAKQKSY